MAASMVSPLPLTAQGYSPAAMEWQKEQRQWLHSGNAAGLAYDDDRNYSDVKIGYEMLSGNYKRPQQGEKDKTLSVSSEGFINLRKMYVWGKLSFRHENVTDARYNASITDPFRGMPFYVTDTNISDWRNQFYSLSFRVGTPVCWSRFTFGLEGIYKASLAAKQRDPRVDTRFYNLQLRPAVTISINAAHRMGANIYYASIKEDSRMTNVNTYVSQEYYILYGLGTASHGLGSGITANYFGNTWGAGVQYQYQQGAWDVLFEAAYDKKIENVEQSYTTPKKLGAVNDKHLALNATAFHKGKMLTHELQAGWDFHHISGVQYLMKRDNTTSSAGWVELTGLIRSTYNTHKLFVKYGIIKPQNDEYDWRADAQVSFVKHDDKYILPLSYKNSEALLLQADMKKNFKLGHSDINHRLLIAVNGGIRNGMSGSYSYGGSNADYPTVTDMEPLDESYLTSDNWNAGIAATYSRLVKAGNKANAFASVKFDYTKSSIALFDKRQQLVFTVGCNF